MEWDDVPLACAAYNFLPSEHSNESPFFLLFGREARISLNTMLQSQIRYLGNDENILSTQALENMYQLVAENLQKARKRKAPTNFPQPTKIKTEDSVMIKDHTAGPFEPVHKGNYHVVAMKGLQVEDAPAEGGKSQMVHITVGKYILPADNIIAKLPDYNKFGWKTNPNHYNYYALPKSNDIVTTTSTPVKISVKTDKPWTKSVSNVFQFITANYKMY